MRDETERHIETARSIERLNVQIDVIERKLDEGFARAEAQMGHMISVLDRHDRQLEGIAAREARWRGAGKWLAGIAASVVVAVLMMVLGLRR